ncbi:Fur family transcriptional regulator [Salinarimonas soli]|uniref:Transcriptional repressor n=1 Tax=Salinarimonas soli TaxID=1638099 RepID=A0A5B2VIF5_9HYPH|nr:Fur family transcriptional regulator [Salinarimonas soli]KAA2238290.1 transcriptional repressor [Salinarimonas soli]
MSAHHHHHHDGACAHAEAAASGAGEALARAEAACRARGVRLTPIRRDVLAALYATHKPLGAYDLVEALRRDGERALAPISIYRALDFLMEQGLAHRLASRNAFVACPHGHGPCDLVAFLICETCGGVDELSSEPLSAALRGLLARERFAPRTQVLEIAGRCSHCEAS